MPGNWKLDLGDLSVLNWWEPDAVVAFDADSGAKVAGHGYSFDGTITLDTNIKMAGSTRSHLFEASALIDCTRDNLATHQIFTDTLSEEGSTILFWVYIPSAIPGSEVSLCDPYRNHSTNNNRFVYRIGYNSANGFALWNNTANLRFNSSVNRSVYPIGEWFEVRIVYDKTDETHVSRLYVDGVLRANGSWNGLTTTAPVEGYLGHGGLITHYMDRYQIVPRILLP